MAIDIDETGAKKLGELLKNLDIFDWSDWELKFLEDNRTRMYAGMTDRQKSTVGRLYDRLLED